MGEEINYLKEESSADPEIKKKVKKILDKGPKNSEDGKFIAQHCNLKIFEEINLFHDKFEFVKTVFDHFLEISEKTDLRKNIFPKYWSDYGSFNSNFIEKEKCSNKDFAENLYKNFDYILDNLKISNNKKFDIMETIFYSIAISDYSEFEFYFLEIFLNLCKNKYKFSQKSLETLSKIYINEIEESFFVGSGTYIYDISKYDLETIENMIKTCKKYEIPQKIFKINTTAPIVDYFFENCSDKIYNS